MRKKERLFGVGQALTGATGQVERGGLGSIALEAVTIGRSLNSASVFSMLPVSRVLRTQHNRVRAHPFLGLCPLRRHNVAVFKSKQISHTPDEPLRDVYNDMGYNPPRYTQVFSAPIPRSCNGSRLKPAVLAFDGDSGSN